MTWQTLGAVTVKATADTTGQNPGNWTASFGPGVLTYTVPQYECYHIVSLGAALNATFNTYVNTNAWDVAVYAHQTSWDPSQPMILNPGDVLNFYFSSLATDGFNPTVTAWFRWDPALRDVFGLG